jgi:hypothetical protein
MKPLYEISNDIHVGIWDNCTRSANIYADKIIVREPYVKWINNSGNLAWKRIAIRDQKTIKAVIADLQDDCTDSAWQKIRLLND